MGTRLRSSTRKLILARKTANQSLMNSKERVKGSSARKAVARNLQMIRKSYGKKDAVGIQHRWLDRHKQNKRRGY